MDRWIWGFEISDMVVADGSKMEMLAHANGGFDRCDFNIRNSDSHVDWTDLGLDNFDIMVFGRLKFKLTRETREMMIDQLDFGDNLLQTEGVVSAVSILTQQWDLEMTVPTLQIGQPGWECDVYWKRRIFQLRLSEGMGQIFPARSTFWVTFCITIVVGSIFAVEPHIYIYIHGIIYIYVQDKGIPKKQAVPLLTPIHEAFLVFQHHLKKWFLDSIPVFR